MESVSMFSHGPVFIVVPCERKSPREALFSKEYAVKLGSMSGNDLPSWKIGGQTEMKKRYNKTFVVGFDAQEQLVDIIDKHMFVEENHDSAFLHCFNMIRCSKTGEKHQPLEDQTDDNNNELHFGSILNFDKVPVEYHLKDTLDFWLSCRGIKVPDRASEIVSLVKLVHDSVGNKLQPIPKAQMKGASGWVTPEVLQMK